MKRIFAVVQPIPGRPSRSATGSRSQAGRSQAARPREYISVQPIPGRPSRSATGSRSQAGRSQAARPREYISVQPIPGRPSRSATGSRARARPGSNPFRGCLYPATRYAYAHTRHAPLRAPRMQPLRGCFYRATRRARPRGYGGNRIAIRSFWQGTVTARSRYAGAGSPEIP